MQSLGPHQLAECMRCGAKVLASSLQTDGRNPRLLVCSKPGCWDPAHPQERPFVVNDVEGLPRFPVAPEHGEDTAPVLEAADGGASVVLEWTAAETIQGRVESYRVYRATGAGAFALLDTLEVTYDGAPQYGVTHPVTFPDNTVAALTAYHYRVDAVTDSGRTIESNEASVTTD
jgi:hypothetical protein